MFEQEAPHFPDRDLLPKFLLLLLVHHSWVSGIGDHCGGIRHGLDCGNGFEGCMNVDYAGGFGSDVVENGIARAVGGDISITHGSQRTGRIVRIRVCRLLRNYLLEEAVRH